MKKLSTLIVFVCLSISLFGQIGEFLDEQFSGLSDSPGLTVAIFKDGKIEISKSYGKANLNHDIPITSKTAFDIGSISKQFTAACIFLLEQEGKLSIDDPIQKWLPEIPVYDDDVVRIRNLINHNSGLRDYAEIMGYSGTPFNNVFTEEMGLDIMVRQLEPNFKAGERFMYNNGGYLLLAIIVRRASGMSIGKYAQTKIFQPLGMKNSFILENPNRIIKNLATGYTRLEDGQIEELHYKNFAIGGDGQVYTTAEDLLLWDNNFYDPKVGGSQLLEKLHAPGLLMNGDTMAYAGGLFIDTYKGHRLVHHTGAWGGFIAAFYRLPDLHSSVLMLANYRRAFSLNTIHSILDELIPAESIAEVGTDKQETNNFKPNPQTLKKYEGLFEVISEPHKRFRTYVENDSLKMDQYWTKQSFTLLPLAEGKFQHPRLSFIQFDFNQPNHYPSIQDRFAELASQPVEAYTPLEKLEVYEGRFYSEEVGVEYVVEAKGNQLLIKRNKEEIYTLDQVRADIFGSNNLGIEFQRSPSGIDGFLLQDRRIRNLRFEKIK